MITRNTQKIDATGKAVGRLATQIALFLRGKHKAEYVPNVDLGDIVEVSNINKVVFTGKKLEQKKYFHFSGYPGGLKEKKMKEVADKDMGEVLRRAVREMLPDNRLRNGMMKRLIIK